MIFNPPYPLSSVVRHTPKSSSSIGTPRKAELVDVSQDLFATPFRSLLPKRLQSQLLSCNSRVRNKTATMKPCLHTATCLDLYHVFSPMFFFRLSVRMLICQTRTRCILSVTSSNLCRGRNVSAHSA